MSSAHGQLLPENVLLRNGLLQVTGFYCCDNGGEVSLRPFHKLYAPEL